MILTSIAESIERCAVAVACWLRRDGPVVGSLSFERKLQGDGWSCGSRSAQAIALHFERSVEHAAVIAACGTTTDGTAATPIIRFLRKLGLRAGYHRHLSLRKLERALRRGCVVLVDIEGIHWATVHACSSAHVWVADPSLRRQLGRRITRTRFREQWTGLAVTVSDGQSRRGPRRD